MSSVARYLRLCAVAFVGTLICVAAFNAYVDPYRLYRLSDASARESVKPRAGQRRFVSKAYGIAHLHPRTLILGNSRAEIGFDPDSPKWPARSAPVFNAAIPGTGLATALAYVQHALAHGEVRQVVVALEFLDFLTDASSPLLADAWSPEPIRLDGWGERVRNAVPTLLSLDALYDSVLTVINRRSEFAEDIAVTGFNPLREYRLHARREGYGALFLQRDQENARAYSRKPKALFIQNTQTSASWRDLDRLLELARRHDFEVKFVIYPYHAHILEMFRLAGLWPSFEQWKGRLVEVLDAETVSNRDTRLELWDFSGYHRYARERVPPLGDTATKLEWYWEAGHFKRELGDEMLARIFGNGDPEFGTRLTRTNLAAQNERIRRARDEFSAAEPAIVAALARLVSAGRN